MKTFKIILLAAAAALPGTVALVAPAAAQVNGIAVANPEAAVVRSKAWTAANQQIAAQYKPQLDQAEARRKAIAAELQPLYTAFDTARRAPGATDASLRTQATAIQTRQTAGEQELGRITAPAQRAQAYVTEQIGARLGEAVTAATTRKNVSLLIRPDAALFAQPVADITADITAELDRLVPSVGIAPPANWQPGQQGQQGQQGAAAAGAAPARTTTPARPTQGR
jgi:Skp family chaperone for outer membrane proteins